MEIDRAVDMVAEIVSAPQYVDAVRTRATPAQVFAAIKAAWPDGSRDSVLTLMAQSGIETADWRSCWNWNLCNIKRQKGALWTMLPSATEILAKPSSEAAVVRQRSDGRWECVFLIPHVQTHFRAFTSLAEGAAHLLESMRTRYAKAWPPLVAGDPDAFAHRLHEEHFYTADPDAYARALVGRFNAFARQV